MAQPAHFLVLLVLFLSCSSSESRHQILRFATADGGNLCNSDKCELQSNWTQQEICDYVGCNDDACEGGGYLLWTQYVECASTAARVVLIIAGVLYMLLLFVMVSSAADDFFSPSISSIVAHLRISESVAGVTFMAFGNGAPDVFGSIASVLSSPTPKADLALGELFGGGLFVVTMVVSTIILTSPFDVEVFSTFRDLIFYLIALAFIAFCLIFYDQVTLWMPLTYLGLYIIYVMTVFGAQAMHNRRRKAMNQQNSTRSAKSGKSTKSVISRRSRQSISPMPVIPEITVEEQAPPFPEISLVTNAIDKLKDHMAEKAATPRRYVKRPSFMIAGDGLPSHLHPYSHSRRGSQIPEAEEKEEEEFVVIHGHVFQGHEARSRANSIVPEPMQISSWQSKDVLTDLCEHLDPRPEAEEWEEMNIVSKTLCLINLLPVFLFRLTIPLNELSWSKPLAFIHAFTCPAFLLFSIQFFLKSPFSGSPGLWLYGFVFSMIIAALLVFFTELSVQPKYYKEFYSYVGFLMSIAWIYLISSEVVNVVTMLGVVSRISHEVLGLTILAWSNSIGDLIADVSVVKQGYPRMAMAAAIGGPLFNLLMGFGLPFTIAKLRGRYISMTINPTYRLLILFLAISLLATLIGIPVQKFRLQRPHAVVLISIYVTFIVFVLLSETNILVWN